MSPWWTNDEEIKFWEAVFAEPQLFGGLPVSGWAPTPAPPTSPRVFESGATRDTDAGKFDYEGFLSPLVLRAYAAYMHKHRVQSDGTLRASDNWQKGIPAEQYLKSLLRHVMDLWLEHRGYSSGEPMSDALAGVMFNTMGYWHERLKAKE